MRPVFQADGEKQMNTHITNAPKHLLLGLCLSFFAAAGLYLRTNVIFLMCTGVLIGWELCQAYIYTRSHSLWFWFKNRIIDTIADLTAGMIGLAFGAFVIYSIVGYMGA